MLAFLVFICFLAFVGSLVALLFKSVRRKAKWIASASFVAMIVAIAIFGGEQNDEARRLGFLDAADQRAAKEAGVTDPVAWRSASEAKRRAERDQKAHKQATGAGLLKAPPENGMASDRDADATPAVAIPQTDYCIVTNPTQTPLTMRTSPNGNILGTLTNNEPVEILDSTSDANGRLWVSLADANGEPLGWIFRNFVTCPSDPGNDMKAQFGHCMEAQSAATNIAEATNGPEVWPFWAQFSKDECADILLRIMHHD